MLCDRKWTVWAFGLFLVMLSGCAVGQTFQGNYFLNMEEYDKGVEEFSKQLRENPDDPLANYYMGRLLLAREEPQKAMPHLQKALTLDPGKAEYHYWAGVGHWALGQSAKERGRYQKALELSPGHVPARVYLGHNFQDAGELSKALEHYKEALKKEPSHPEALYNRALVLQKMDRKEQEVSAWKEYLDHYPDGPLARNAAQYLNARGDFSYRLHGLGNRRVVLEWIEFLPGTATLHPDAGPSLQVVGEMLQKNEELKLAIESYYTGNATLARQRAEAVQEFLTRRYGVDPARLPLESFGRAERILAGENLYGLDHSIVFKTR
ncbi:MAG: tetratricopeptide repeat protein [Desulfovibrionales bacterium]